MPIRFTTKDLAPPSQFEAWRTFMAPAVDLELADGPNAGFPADQIVWDLGSIALTRALMPGPGQERIWRHLSRKSLDHWCLVLVERPEGRSLYLRSLGQPFQGSGSDANVISLYVPRDLLPGLSGSLNSIAGEIPATGLGLLLTDYVASLDKRMPAMGSAERPQLIEATRVMIIACLSQTPRIREDAREVIAGSMVERARTIIQKNLLVPAFGPEQLGRMLGVSRSRLYRLFEPLGGVTSYIRRQRLLAAHEALADPESHERIAQVAEGFGFGDASGFSRAFRQEFGYSPTYARAAGSIGAVPPFVTLPPSAQAISSLGDVLWRLHA